jgi:hypothetical protein
VADIFAITMIFGVGFEPIGGVVDVQNFTGCGDELSNLSKNGAVYVLGFIRDVGHAVTSLRLITSKHAKTEAFIRPLKLFIIGFSPFRKSL